MQSLLFSALWGTRRYDLPKPLLMQEGLAFIIYLQSSLIIVAKCASAGTTSIPKKVAKLFDNGLTTPRRTRKKVIFAAAILPNN